MILDSSGFTPEKLATNGGIGTGTTAGILPNVLMKFDAIGKYSARLNIVGY
jgi:hypothetical protein